MKLSPANAHISPSRWLHLLSLFSLSAVLVLSMLHTAPTVQAEGSFELNNNTGNRPFLEERPGTIGGLNRRNVIHVYAKAGETIQVASSAISFANGTIEVFAPNSPNNPYTFGSAPTQTFNSASGCGSIPNRAAEVAGPNPGGGYNACNIAVTAATEGIWSIRFNSPNNGGVFNPGSGINNVAATAEWSPQPNNSVIAAWDVTVRDAANVKIPGRVYAKYLPLNMGSNSTLAPGATTSEFSAIAYAQTYDGALYKLDMNKLDPFAVIFFVNSKGFRDSAGEPIYRSVQFVDNSSETPVLFGNIPSMYSIHNPAANDIIASNDITHKIFFNEPAADLPLSAPVAGEGNTWLKRPYTPPQSPQNFSFTGIEGTPNSAGTNPLGGYFSFNNPNASTFSYSIRIDLDQNGTFGDNNDRILIGSAVSGDNQVFWDGLDANGNPVTPSPEGFGYNATIQFNSGEVHFPFFDAESNPSGFKIQRLFPTSAHADDNPFSIYFDDRYNYTGFNEYDYSLCGAGEAPSPPNVLPLPRVIGPPGNRPADFEKCYGTPSTPRQALNGIDSSGGAHIWGVGDDPQNAGFGNIRGIDTWTYIPSAPLELENRIAIREADLAISKSVTVTPVNPGDPIEFTITVRNDGPSNVRFARVIDDIPIKVINTTWTCAVTEGTGECVEAGGAGNTINTRVHLDADAEITLTVLGIVDPDADHTGMVNIAVVERPNDVTDPNPANNVAVARVQPLDDKVLGLTKQAVSVAHLGGNDYQVTYDIKIFNLGNTTITNLQVADDFRNTFPAPATFQVKSVESLPDNNLPLNAGYNGGTSANLLTLPNNLHVGAVEILRIVVNVNTGGGLGPHGNGRYDNSATASATDIPTISSHNGTNPDPNGNGTPNQPGVEDDPTPVFLTTQPRADLSLIKTASPQVVALGGQTTFTIQVTNNGPNQATGVTVQDQLPVGLEFVSATPSQGTYTQATGIWTVGTLNNQATVTLTIVATVTKPGVLNNSAEIMTSDQLDPDSTPGNDIPTEDDQDTSTVTVLSIGLAKAAASVTPLGNNQFRVVFNFVVKNFGTLPLNNVQVQDNLATTFANALSWEVVSASSADLTVNPSFTGTSPNINLLAGTDTLAVGGEGTIQVVVDVNPGDKLDPYQNQGLASGTNGGVTTTDLSTNGTNPDPNGDGVPSESIPTPVQFPPTPQIQITKSVVGSVNRVGKNLFAVTYDLLVENKGNVALSAVQVTDDLNNAFSGVASFAVQGISSDDFTVNPSFNGTTNVNMLSGADTLAFNGSGTIRIVVHVDPGDLLGTYSNSAMARGGYGSDVVQSNSSAHVDFPSITQIGIAERVADSTRLDDRRYQVIYELNVVNLGNTDLSNVQITNNLATTFAGATSFSVQGISSDDFTVNPSFNGTTNVNMLSGADTLAFNRSGTIRIVVNVTPGANPGPYDNSAVASAQYGPTTTTDTSNDGTDPDPNNNGNPGDPNEDTPTRVQFDLINLVLTKRVDPTAIDFGDEATFTIEVRNNGPSNATGVAVTEELPAGLTFISSQVSQGTYNSNTSIWTIGAINANASATLTLRVSTGQPGTFVNSAQVSAADQMDINSVPGNNVLTEDDQDSASLVVRPPTPAFELFKQATLASDNDNNGIPSPGDVLEYVVTIENTGQFAATNVRFNDVLDTNTTLVPGSLQTSQGSIVQGTTAADRSLEIEVGTVLPSSPVTIRFRVTINAPLSPSITHVRNQGILTGSDFPSLLTDDPTTPTPRDPTIVPITQSPELLAFKRDTLVDKDNNGMASAGDTIRYEVTIHSIGNTTAIDVQFINTPDPNTTLVVGSVQTSQGTVVRGNGSGDRTLEIVIGDMAPGTVVTIQFDVTINDPLPRGITEVSNQGVVTSSNVPALQTDDPDTPEVGDPTRTPIGDTPGMSALKQGTLLDDNNNDGIPSAGDVLLYQITIRNDSRATAIEDVVFRDELDQNVSLIVGSVQTNQGTVHIGNAPNDALVEVHIGTLAVGGEVTISFQVTVNSPLPASVTEIVNQGEVTSSTLPRIITFDPNSLRHDDPTVITIRPVPRLQAEKQMVSIEDTNQDGMIGAGDELLYQVIIRNRGTADATSVIFDDKPDPNTTLVVGSVQSTLGTIVGGNAQGQTRIRINIGTIPADGSVRISYLVRINDPLPSDVRQIVNQGIITSFGRTDLPTDDPTTPEPDDPTAVWLSAIRITKDANQTRVVPNQEIVYTLRVENPSLNTAFLPVDVTDVLPAGMEYIAGSASPLQPTVTGQTLRWNNIMEGDAFVPGASFVITYRAVVRGEAGQYDNIATVEGQYPGGSLTDTDDAGVFVEDPGVAISKTAVTPGFVDDEITFTIVITNTGQSTLTTVPLTDQFFGPIAYVRGTVPPDTIDNKAQVLRWNDLTTEFGDMRPGDVFRIDTVFRLTVENPTRIEVENIALVSESTDEFGNRITDVTGRALITSDVPSAITLLSFTAHRQSNGIDLRWTTGAEQRTWGFHLWRSRDGTRGNAERITPALLPAQGNSLGASYSWLDQTARDDGVRYTYWLEEIDLDENRTEYGPVYPMSTVQHEMTQIFFPIIRR